VKICGCTSVADIEGAVEAGADYVGMIFAPSTRRISFEQGARIAQAVPDEVAIVGVFIDPSKEDLDDALEAIPRMQLQFSGSESPELCRSKGAPFTKVFHIDGDAFDLQALRQTIGRYEGGLAMFETASAGRGGSGRPFDWSLIEPLAHERQLAISGGLKPENVAACVRSIRPYFVDVRTGVETGDAKDTKKMRAFVHAVREADAEA
jgi:phosphoribosylanthranilate isomerase